MTLAVLFAFGAILLWDLSNFIDKLLLSRYAVDSSRDTERVSVTGHIVSVRRVEVAQ